MIVDLTLASSLLTEIGIGFLSRQPANSNDRCRGRLREKEAGSGKTVTVVLIKALGDTQVTKIENANVYTRDHRSGVRRRW